MANETEGQRAFKENVALALRLLNQGHSPEEVEVALEVRRLAHRPPTALSDPNNVLMQEVAEDGARSS